MSDSLHVVRLWWNAGWGRGGGVYEGYSWPLIQRPPVLLALGRLVEIEYAPLTGVKQYQLATGARDDMRPEHAAECLAYLRHVANGARDLAAEWRP